MRASAAACVLFGLLLGACGFPDYGFEHAPSTSVDGGGGHASGGTSGRGGEGGADAAVQGGAAAGRGGARDAGLDAHLGCSINDDCVGTPGRPLCDHSDGQCVACRPGQGDCAAGTYCGAFGFCELGCESDPDCVGAASLPRDGGTEAGTPVDGGSRDAGVDAHSSKVDAGDAGTGTGTCDPERHVCDGCQADDDCPPGFACDVAARRCAPRCDSKRACPSGFACCDGQCEDLSRSPESCGACGRGCARDAGLGACVEGSCQPTACRPGFGDCNGDPRDGCEVDLTKDPTHCGSCDGACPTPNNASPACVQGACVIGPCNASFADCDQNPATACEVNLEFNTDNCGTCGFACDLLNANPRCESAACAIVNCKAGFANCDRLTSTGCEVNTQSDPSNCGACGNVCAFPSADALCQGGACRLGPCLGGAADCNADPSDGCEVNTSTDVGNCGTCARACTLAHATSTCTDGVCGIAQCDPGYGDCNGVTADGCETNLDTSATSCGACGQACSTNHDAPSCALGGCSVACAQGFADCDGDRSNGCETGTTSNVEHCGNCNGVCSTAGGTPNCVGGVCGLSACSGTLADCNASNTDGCEVDTASDVANCGGCGKACFVANGTANCSGSACAVESCKAGFANCNSNPSDGCETRLDTLGDCGACDKACALSHANASCVTGACQVASCVTPFADCDGVASNGCETDTSGDVKNCGGCGNACDATNGTPKCVNGSCAITCNPGFANCNAAVSDGCERATKNDVANCGGCGLVCAVQNGTSACVGTTCSVATCTPPFADCDHAYATGCETNLNTSIARCGACGNACDTSRGTPTCIVGTCVTP